ncbi:putative reverse transcriptase domain-containing protein [Tanacetum coccineum]
MDLVTKLPRSSGGYDTIWFIVNTLTKSSHFLPIREDYKMEKLARIYINEIVARHGVPVIHETFHMSNLKKCLADANLQVPLEEIKINDKLHFVKEPVEVVDREVKKLKRKRIPIVKVCWNSKRGAEFTWEREDRFKSKYPHLFAITSSAAVTS